MCREIEDEIGEEKLVGAMRFGIIRDSVLADSLSLHLPPIINYYTTILIGLITLNLACTP